MVERPPSFRPRTRVRRTAAIVATALLAAGLPGCTTRPGPRPDLAVSGTMPLLVCLTDAGSWERRVGDGGTTVLTSPWIRFEQPWDELIVSWNIDPPEHAGLTLHAQAATEDHETGEYHLGSWSLEGKAPVNRTSLDGQADAHGDVKTDTLVLRQPHRALRLRLTLAGTLAEAPSHLRLLALSVSHAAEAPPSRPPQREVWGRPPLAVPERSQIAYPGGEGWCSPTSVSMLLGWWAKVLHRPELDRDVPEVALGVHDPGWPGTGNWPFNMAYAGGFRGLTACAARLPDLRAVEDLVLAGIPVALSVHAPALRGEPLRPGGGHLVVCVGFTETGDVVVNNPWARLDQGQRVRRVYPRANVERAWDHAQHLTYLIVPEEHRDRLPAVWVDPPAPHLARPSTVTSP